MLTQQNEHIYRKCQREVTLLRNGVCGILVVIVVGLNFVYTHHSIAHTLTHSHSVKSIFALELVDVDAIKFIFPRPNLTNRRTNKQTNRSAYTVMIHFFLFVCLFLHLSEMFILFVRACVYSIVYTH